MYLSNAAVYILHQLADFVEQVKEDDFSKPSHTLSVSTLGQHIRHTLEFFLCFKNGVHSGVINYDKRAHDRLMESDKNVALSALRDMIRFILHLQQDRTLKLEIGMTGEEGLTIPTNCSRELLYNIEHAVHHMALIKIGVLEVAPYVILSKDFGIATSTLEYNKASFTHD